MAYFQQNEIPVEDVDAQELMEEDPQPERYFAPDTYFDTDDYFDDYLDEIEQQEEKQARWRTLAGVGDFFAVIAGAAVILVLVALLVSLITWVQADISQSFTLWQTKL